MRSKAKTKAKKPRIRGSVLVEPDPDKLERLGAKLQPFPALDLRTIVEDAKASSELTAEKIRAKHKAEQIEQILAVLGFQNPTARDWIKAFYLLAEALLGVGHVAYTPKRSSRSAAKWDRVAEWRLLGFVIELTDDGLSEMGALDAIAADPEKWRLLPHQQRGNVHWGGKKEQKKRAGALKQQLNRMKKRSGGTLERALVLATEGESPKSPLAQRHLEFELGLMAGRPAGDKRNG